MHFYELLNDGEIKSQHYVPMATRPDEIRPTRVSDVKKMIEQGRKLAPSVTTILDILNKFALNNWRIEQHLKVAFQKPCKAHGNDGVEAYIKEIKRLTEIELDRAPQAGTDFHKLMEDYIRLIKSRLTVIHKKQPVQSKIVDLIHEKTEISVDLWRPEVNIFSDLGYAGQADLIIEGDETWFIDYKTKETAKKFKPGKMAFPNHAQQLAAYREVVCRNARCVNVFVCLETGEIDWHEWKEEDLKKGFEVFKHCLAIYKLVNKL